MDEPTYVVERNPRLRMLIPSVVAIAFLMEQLDSTIITTAIPHMARSLATTPVRMNLAVAAYVLTLAVFIPLSGWFADRFGARRIFVLALAIFTVGSALCGLADSFAMLVAHARAAGLGRSDDDAGRPPDPAAQFPAPGAGDRDDLHDAAGHHRAGHRTAARWLPDDLQHRGAGSSTSTCRSGWSASLLALRFMEDVAGDSAVNFDFAGFLMFGCAIALLQIGMENIGRPALPILAIAGLFAAAAALLLGFSRYARRIAAPVVDLSLFRQRSFAIGTLAGGVCRVALNGTPFLLPLMLQVGFGMSPIASGSLTFLSTGGAIAMRLVLVKLLRSFGFARVLIGSAIIASTVLAGFMLIGPQTPRWLIGVYVVLFGLTRSTQFMSSNTLSYADTPSERLSQATSLGGLIQQLTVSFGVSLSAVLLGLLSAHGHALTPARFHEVFLLTALLPLLALPGFLRLRPEDGAQVSGYRRR